MALLRILRAEVAADEVKGAAGDVGLHPGLELDLWETRVAEPLSEQKCSIAKEVRSSAKRRA